MAKSGLSWPPLVGNVAPNLKGKCGVCEFRDVCGGSRARAYALTGDVSRRSLAASGNRRSSNAATCVLAECRLLASEGPQVEGFSFCSFPVIIWDTICFQEPCPPRKSFPYLCHLNLPASESVCEQDGLMSGIEPGCRFTSILKLY